MRHAARIRPIAALFAAAVMLFVAGPSHAQASDDSNNSSDTLHGLFIGNSYLDFYVIPGQVAGMFRHAGQPAHFRRETKGGFSLDKHWDAGEVQDRIVSEADWSFIALQNHSRSSLDDRERFDEYGETFIDFIREQRDSEIYLYLTWARKNSPDHQATINEAYCSLAARKDVKVAPVGIAITSWRQDHPDLEVLRDDKASHPNELGAYLAACVWYATLSGESPVGQTPRVEGYNWLTKGDTLVDLDPAVARQLQQHAWDTVENFDVADHAAAESAGSASR